jgi:hypothetical protein
VGDFHDNAIFVANADQRDTDGDGYGNIIDADFNQDGFVDFFDLSLMEELFFQAPSGSYVDGAGATAATAGLPLIGISAAAPGDLVA